jgi:hypothetical protein
VNARSAMFALLVGCADTTPPWDLTHDRVIAVRATPPGLAAGERATIDGLIARMAEPLEVAPASVTLASTSPVELEIHRDDGGWSITAPAEPALGAARVALGLAEGAPVPVTLTTVFAIGGIQHTATKRVVLGSPAENPEPTVLIDGRTNTPQITTGLVTSLVTNAADQDEVDWLTSLGTLEDADDPVGHLTVDEPGPGTLVVVRRDPTGGVGWAVASFEAVAP